MQRERDPNSLLAPQNIAVVILDRRRLSPASAIAWGSLKLGWPGPVRRPTCRTTRSNLLLLAVRRPDPVAAAQATYSAGAHRRRPSRCSRSAVVRRSVRRLRRPPDPGRPPRHGTSAAAATSTSHLEGAPSTADRAAARRHRRHPGVFIGRTVAAGADVFGSWEDMHRRHLPAPAPVRPPRRAVPAILDAPGAVVATSNKRDILDATRGPRRRRRTGLGVRPAAGRRRGARPGGGTRSATSPTTTPPASSPSTSRRLPRPPTPAPTRSSTPPAPTCSPACCSPAAAAERPITQVYSWLDRPANDEPERILRDHGDCTWPRTRRRRPHRARASSAAACSAPPSRCASCLVQPGHPLGQPDRPDDTAPASSTRTSSSASGGTLYSLSKEGAGTAGPLVTALTVAVVEAAEDYATTCPGGRLPIPLVGVLDEAANVCRWKDLPDLYSHYGSRGIVLMTILQSWAQGVECWGERGMEKLWSAANIRVYGGGVADATFLERLSKLIGDRELLRSSTSTSKQGTSVNRQLQREQILDVAELAALPAGRAIVFSSGSRATLIRSIPWMERPYADRVRASLARHDPGARNAISPTIAPTGEPS